MALTINIPDTLRKQVEASSQGKNTVMYTAKNQPCYMYVQEKFNDEFLGTTHLAFIVGGVEKSYIYLGMYLGHSRNGEMLSLPGVDPVNTITHDAAVDLARANGTGWHAMNNLERAAVAQSCRAAGFQPRGNNNYGRSSDRTTERGVDTVTGLLAPTTGTTTNRTRTGSGPTSWRHTNSAFGMSDLNGCVWEWSPGMRVVAGEIQLFSSNGTSFDNNTLALPASAMAGNSFGTGANAGWYAINGATGAPLVPTYTGSISAAGVLSSYVVTTVGSVRYATATSAQDYTFWRASGQSFEAMAQGTGAQVSGTALAVCKAHGIFPAASLLGGTIAAPVANGDGFYLSTTIEALPIRGGTFNNSSLSGVFALNCSNPRSHASSHVGARPALIL
jgi:hypothetical protein